MEDSEHPSNKHPFLWGLLVGLQMLAMGLCALVIMNMLLDQQKSPVPQCPLKPDTTAVQ